MSGYLSSVAARGRGAGDAGPRAQRTPRFLPRAPSQARADVPAGYEGVSTPGVPRVDEPTAATGLRAEGTPARPHPAAGPARVVSTRSLAREQAPQMAPPAAGARPESDRTASIVRAGADAVRQDAGASRPVATTLAETVAPSPSPRAAVLRPRPTVRPLPGPQGQAPAPRIEVHVGRVEVRAPRPAARPQIRAPRAAPPRPPAGQRGFGELAAARRHVDRIAR